MSAYRMYFLIMGQIQGREDFEAANDVAGIRIARVLYDTCSDVCDGFDLWQGKRQLRARQPHHQKASLTDLIEAHQRVAIQKEEDISQSRWMIARSRRLIEALDRTKSPVDPILAPKRSYAYRRGTEFQDRRPKPLDHAAGPMPRREKH